MARGPHTARHIIPTGPYFRYFEISNNFIFEKTNKPKKKQFQERFAPLDAKANEIRLLSRNPFDCNAENLPTQFRMEFIDLEADDRLKDK